jgi:uncharacterized repeat protein (TIGR01451 family)
MRAHLFCLLLFVAVHGLAQKPVDVPSRAAAVPPQIDASENTVINYTGVVPATFSGALDADDSTYNRALSCAALSAVGTAVAYDTVTVNNPTGSAANFVVTSSLIGGGVCGDANDTFFTLYSTSFNPASPLSNCLAVHDDIGGAANRCSTLSFSVPAGGTRIVAIAGFNNAAAATGLFSYQVSFAGTATACVSNPVVANGNDDAAGSLRQAIADACPGDTITFAPAVTTVTLTSAELLVDKDLTIDGGAGVAVARQAGSPAFRIFNITSGDTAVLDSLTISNGSAPSEGGGVFNAGTLTLVDSNVTGNASTAGNGGGGIANRGTLTFSNGTISNNTSAFTGGGVVQIDGGTMTLSNCLVNGNTAAADGGGLTSQSISVAATLTVTNCTFTANNASVNAALLNVSNGAAGNANAVLTNNTFAGNVGPGRTVRNAGGAGVALMSLRNNVFANNASLNVSTGGVGVTTSLGGNVSSDASGGGGPGDLINANALLAPLGSYGGPTQTYALLPGSPAINAGTSTGAPAADQRGIARPQLVGIDSGAFESRGFALTVASGTPQSTALNAAFAAPLVVGVTANAAGEPVDGGLIGYAAPGAGASAALVTSPATIAGGQASVTATANGTPGTYNVTAATNGASGTPTFVLTNVRSIDLGMTLTDSPDPVIAGHQLTYVATLSNAGPNDALDVSITLPLPVGTTYVLSTASAGSACVTPALGATGSIVCTWAGPTPVGTLRTVMVASLVGAAVANGTLLSATAVAAGTGTDPNAANNSATTTTTVNASANLSITLTDNPDPVTAGTNLTYVATLSNGGPSDAQNVSITVPLPLFTSQVSLTGSAGANCAGSICTWPGATAPGATRTATLVVLVGAGTANGSVLSTTATAVTVTTDPTPGNNTATATTTVNASADLSVTLTDAPDPVIAGTQLTYTAVVANAGPSDATGVVLTLPTPANTSFVSGSVSGGGACAGSPVVCTVTGGMAPATSRTISIVMLVAASAPEGSTIDATATVTAASPDPNTANNSASTTTSIITQADLMLGFSASANLAFINVPVTFTATSLNQGPSDAQNVSITIALTPDFRFTSLVATGATCTTPQVGTTGAIVCTWAGATAPGVTRTLDVVAFSNVEGQTAVNASTTSNTGDPDPSTNNASLSVQIGYLVEEIPTLSGLGLILLGLMIGLIGFATVRRQA